MAKDEGICQGPSQVHSTIKGSQPLAWEWLQTEIVTSMFTYKDLGQAD